jgi:hypothetical protein
MERNEQCSGRVKGLIGSIFTNTTIHPYFDLFLYVVWNLEIFGLFLGRNQIEGMKFEEISLSMIGFMVWTVFGMSFLTVGGVFMIIALGNQKSE